jgi:hypothetical protein
MRIVALTCVVLIACGLAGAPAVAGAQGGSKSSVVQDSPEWRKLKTLVGVWEGTMEDAGQKMPAALEVRMTGDGSTIMHILGKDTPYEMVTMFHPDGKRLLATHYCSAHNQPRMAGTAAKAPNQVAFTFIDGTNIAPGDGYINGVTLTFVDADHHDETWSHSSGPSGAVFKFTRKK